MSWIEMSVLENVQLGSRTLCVPSVLEPQAGFCLASQLSWTGVNSQQKTLVHRQDTDPVKLGVMQSCLFYVFLE